MTAIRSPAFRRWNGICNRAYALDNAGEVIAEFQRRLNEIGDLYINSRGSATDARYDLCSDTLLAILEPKVTLSVQADEYEECMRAEEIMESL